MKIFLSSSAVTVRLLLSVLIAVLVFGSGGVAAAPKALMVGDFTSGIIDEWEEQSISGQTEYRVIQEGSVTVLQASAKNSASALVKVQRIDLWQTPVINWRWKIDNRLPARNETTAEGDDYPAALYMVYGYDKALWKSKSLAYVWSRGVSKTSTWRNANNVQNLIMMSVRDATDNTGVWYTEKRNVLKELQQLVDPKIRYIDAVAVMSDSESTNAFVNAFYGDIYFSAE